MLWFFLCKMESITSFSPRWVLPGCNCKLVPYYTVEYLLLEQQTHEIKCWVKKHNFKYWNWEILFHGQHPAFRNIPSWDICAWKISIWSHRWKIWSFICLSKWNLNSWRCSRGKQDGNPTFKPLYLGARCFPKGLQLSSFMCTYKTAHLCILNWIWV